MLIEFHGKKVLITGAAQGIGRQISLQFAQSGASLALCDFNKDELETTVSLCQELTSAVHSKVFDIKSRDNIQEFVKEIGHVDIYVHVAGGVCGQVGKPIEEISPQDFHDIFAVNSDAMFWFSQAVIPSMKAKGFGRIITISSMAGLNVSLTGIQAYAATKAAEISLTRQLAHELGSFGITVNCVAPGFILSNPATLRQWQAYGEEGQKKLVDNIAMKRTGKPEDIAPAVLYFASTQASWTTGQTLVVDGGK